MQPRSERAAAAVQSPDQARIVSRVDVLVDGEVVTVVDAPRIAGGRVNGDATADIGRSLLGLDLAVQTTPAETRQMFIPGVTEVAIHRGFQWPDGSSELAPIGVFGVSSCPISVGSGVRVAITGFDRARAYQKAGVVRPIRLAPGDVLEEVVADVLRDRVPRIPVALPVTGITLASWTTLDVGDDPWVSLREVYESFGWDLYLDPSGVARGRSLNAATDPVAVYGPDAARVILSAELEPTDEDVYSGVIVVGTGPDQVTPVRGIAWDLDPQSPTYVYGPFGERPLVIRSEQVTTQDQADTTAEAKLPDVTGVSEPISFSQLVDPWLEARDVVMLIRPELGVSRPYRLETLATPLTASEPMAATGKQVRQWT